MAKRILRLSDIKVKALKAEGMHADGAGLYVRVTSTGTRSWVFRFKRGGKSRDMGLGTYPAVGLKRARTLAEDARGLLQQGLDPIERRKVKVEAPQAQLAPAIVTFDQAAQQYIAAQEAGWRNAKHRQQWTNTLATYASPIVGNKDVATISADDVMLILDPIWRVKPETASRLRSRIELVLEFAKAKKWRGGENPAVWRANLKALLPSAKKLKAVRHHPALPWREIPKFMAELRGNSSQSARALEFIILTAARTSEALEGRWSEIDMGEAVWTVPPERMKGGREHRVPLTGEAMSLLTNLIRLDDGPYLFPGARAMRPLSNMAALELLRGMRPGLTVHGFRSCFRDWAAETTAFPREIAEAALAHLIGGPTARAYQRGDLFEKRLKLMEAWADFCTRTGQVIPLRSNA